MRTEAECQEKLSALILAQLALAERGQDLRSLLIDAAISAYALGMHAGVAFTFDRIRERGAGAERPTCQDP